MNELKSLLEAQIKVMANIISKDDFAKAFKAAMDLIAKALTNLNKKIDDRLSKIKNGVDGKDGAKGDKGDKGDRGDKGERGATFIALRGAQGLQGAPGKDGSPDTGETIVDKINALSTDEDVDKIDASHIKNLPKQKDSQVILTGHHPLWQLQDVDVAGITAGQAIKWTGVRWIPYTPSGGNTSVYNEVVAGATNTFTLANTPVAGTVRVYANGQRLVPTTDYTIAGAIITTVSAWSAGQITSDYEYV